MTGRYDARRRSGSKASNPKIIGGEECPAVSGKCLNELALAALNGINVPCPLGVHGINGGNHTDPWSRQGTERPDVALHIHAHFSDVSHGPIGEIQERHR